MHAADSKKLEFEVMKVLTDAITQNKRIALVDSVQFFETCRFAFLKRKDFRDSVDGFLASLSFRKEEAGQWLYTEYGDGYDAFIKLIDHNPDRIGIAALMASDEVLVHRFSRVKTPVEKSGLAIKVTFENGHSEVIYDCGTMSDVVKMVENDRYMKRFGKIIEAVKID